MEVAFACGAFAKVAGYYSGVEVGVLESLDLEGVGCTCGLGDLGREGRGDCVLIESVSEMFVGVKWGYTILSLLLP